VKLAMQAAALSAGHASVTTAFATVGMRQLVAAYGGDGTNPPATSPTIGHTVNATVLTPTTTSLLLSPNPVAIAAAATFTATVAPNPASGAVEWIIDGVAAGTTPVGPAGTATTSRTYDAPGTHTVQAHFTEGTVFDESTSPQQVLTVSVTDTGVSASGVGVSSSTFYPYKDGYRDTVAIRGTPGEPLSVVVKVYNTSRRTVRSWSLASRTAAWSISWNGRNAAGTRLPAGKYRVTQTLRDALGHTREYRSYVTISNKRLYWHTASIARYGNQYSMYGDPGSGSVSRSASSYSRGVRLTSGTSWVAVRYSFTLHSATIYEALKFKVLGRSRNGSTAEAGLWNRMYGSNRDVACYDRKTIGPGYRWYTIGADSATHRSGRSAYGIVFVDYANGIRTFDVAKIRLTYRYAILR
jgi:hypothetical protein